MRTHGKQMAALARRSIRGEAHLSVAPSSDGARNGGRGPASGSGQQLFVKSPPRRGDDAAATRREGAACGQLRGERAALEVGDGATRGEDDRDPRCMVPRLV